MTVDLTKLSAEERAILIQQAKELEAKEIKKRREAYEEMKMDAIVSLITMAKDINKELAEFKKHSFDTMDALYELLKEYSGRHAEGKGNFKIEFENLKVEYNKQGKGSYDERATEAEKYIFDFIESRYSGDEGTKEFILSLLERKKGELDPDNIQKLYKYEGKFNDPNFSRACELFRESYQYSHSKDYIRFYEKDERGQWKNILLQFSAV
jgi:hypothetical protein|nr:MAG TPA: Protein of unknown function (DUF3164) [Caudoviricetes sp.]